MTLLKHLPIVFLSYDETNAYSNFKHLSQDPSKSNLHRVQGVTGFDAAHLKARQLANTEWFITVDGDCKVHPLFWEQPFIPQGTVSFTWKSINLGNGLTYGNGGVKLWHSSFFDTHLGHENNSTVLDFCYNKQTYQNYASCVSMTNPYDSYRTAHRSGFREGVKLILKEGNPDSTIDIFDTHFSKSLNFLRLQAWASLGSHLDHGIDAQLGTLRALYHVHVTKLVSPTCVSSYASYDLALSRILKEESINFGEIIVLESTKLVDFYKDKFFQKTGLYFPKFGNKQSQFIVNSRLKEYQFPADIYLPESYYDASFFNTP